MMRTPFALLAMAAAVVLAAGCATTSSTPPATPAEIGLQFSARSYVLLGEVHDSAAAHQQRLQALTRAVEAGWRPAIAMEQFDRERQPDIDRARRQRPHDADDLVEQAAGSNSGWDWALYKPVVALALQYDLPLRAANLSRADAAKIVRSGYDDVFAKDQQAALRLDGALLADIVTAQTAALDAGHCGHFPKSMLPGMLHAQAARDAVMAQTLRPYASRGAVLIAGNGHVRRDIGVPRWLPDDGSRVLSIGYIETDSPDKGFDVVVRVPTQEREDPCKGAVMGKPMKQ